MRHLIAISLLTVSLVGCAHSNREAALRTWHSPSSTPGQRAHAVSELVQKGASRQSVESVLGTSGAWTRFHGPSLDGLHTPPRPLPDHDFWCLVYDFPGGGVQLYFDPPTAFGDRFVRATPFRTLFNIPITSAP
jgi:hypothetical protein